MGGPRWINDLVYLPRSNCTLERSLACISLSGWPELRGGGKGDAGAILTRREMIPQTHLKARLRHPLAKCDINDGGTQRLAPSARSLLQSPPLRPGGRLRSRATIEPRLIRLRCSK